MTGFAERSILKFFNNNYNKHIGISSIVLDQQLLSNESFNKISKAAKKIPFKDLILVLIGDKNIDLTYGLIRLLTIKILEDRIKNDEIQNDEIKNDEIKNDERKLYSLIRLLTKKKQNNEKKIYNDVKNLGKNIKYTYDEDIIKALENKNKLLNLIIRFYNKNSKLFSIINTNLIQNYKYDKIINIIINKNFDELYNDLTNKDINNENFGDIIKKLNEVILSSNNIINNVNDILNDDILNDNISNNDILNDNISNSINANDVKNRKINYKLNYKYSDLGDNLSKILNGNIKYTVID